MGWGISTQFAITQSMHALWRECPNLEMIPHRFRNISRRSEMFWHSPSPARFTPLRPNQNWVHVWRSDLVLPPALLDHMSTSLSLDEWARAKRFRCDRDRDRFIASRAILRQILSRYIDVAAGNIEFDYGAKGKPFLAAQDTTLEFNLSHSGDVALYAVSHHPLGVDVEQIKSRSRLEQLVRHCLTSQEQNVWQQLPDTEKMVAFLRFWTCKEAYLKAVGLGLTQAMTEIEVEFCPQPILRQDPHRLAAAWTLQELTLGDGYVAAIAVAGRDLQLSGWEYDPSVLEA